MTTATDETTHTHQFVNTGTGLHIPRADGSGPFLGTYACGCGERICVISESHQLGPVEGALFRQAEETDPDLSHDAVEVSLTGEEIQALLGCFVRVIGSGPIADIKRKLFEAQTALDLRRGPWKPCGDCGGPTPCDCTLHEGLAP